MASSKLVTVAGVALAIFALCSFFIQDDNAKLVWLWARDALMQALAALAFYIAIGAGVLVLRDAALSVRELFCPMATISESGGELDNDEHSESDSGKPDTPAFLHLGYKSDITSKLSVLFVASAFVWYELLRLDLISVDRPLEIPLADLAAFLLRGTLLGMILGLLWVAVGCVWVVRLLILGRTRRELQPGDDEIEIEVLDIADDGTIRRTVKPETV